MVVNGYGWFVLPSFELPRNRLVAMYRSRESTGSDARHFEETLCGLSPTVFLTTTILYAGWKVHCPRSSAWRKVSFVWFLFVRLLVMLQIDRELVVGPEVHPLLIDL